MSKSIAVVALLALVTLGRPTPALAQARSTVTPAGIEAAVLSAPEADRAEVGRFLTNDQVIAAAARMGVTQRDLAARASRLDDAGMTQLAARTRDASRDLAGGNETIVISATTVIIALLILILLTS